MSFNRIRFLALVAIALGGCGPLRSSSEPAARPGATVQSNGVKASTGGLSSQDATTVRKSIGAWVTCDGRSDDAPGVARAFAAARNSAFTLVVDCPVRLAIGTDIARTVFIDDGTIVEFVGTGKFIVDNVFHPAFVIANSKNIRLKGWNVEYDASLPVNWDVGGFTKNGQFIAAAGYAQPAFRFNDMTLTSWLATNRGVAFSHVAGKNNAVAPWVGPTNTAAVFFFTGDTSNVNVTGMSLYVPATSGGDRFIPMAFSFTQNYKSDQTVTSATPQTAQYFAVPHDLVFSDIRLDGTYMGWQGNMRNVIFEHIRSHRYGDLQDSDGGTVGGVGKWFAPPHLFYLSYRPEGDPALFNQNIRITDVADDGPRIGAARDKGGADSVSGYALSLKIGCVSCSVDNYRSTRPDGFLDVLPSDGLTISNVVATYDSAFLNNVFPGWRFPRGPYRNVTFENITLSDSASSSVQAPIGGASEVSNEGIVFRDVKVGINRWAGQGQLPPTFAGQRHKVSLDYLMRADASRLVSSHNGMGDMTLQATPATVLVGETTVLKWITRGAVSCFATGAWAGVLAAVEGSRVVKLNSAGNYDFTLNCQNASASSSTTLHVVVR